MKMIKMDDSKVSCLIFGFIVITLDACLKRNIHA